MLLSKGLSPLALWHRSKVRRQQFYFQQAFIITIGIKDLRAVRALIFRLHSLVGDRKQATNGKASEASYNLQTCHICHLLDSATMHCWSLDKDLGARRRRDAE